MRIALTGNPIVEKQPCIMRLQEEMTCWKLGRCYGREKGESNQEVLF